MIVEIVKFENNVRKTVKIKKISVKNVKFEKNERKNILNYVSKSRLNFDKIGEKISNLTKFPSKNSFFGKVSNH